jgi:hypothetical protein
VAARLAVGVVLLLWSCSTSDTEAKTAKKSPKREISWHHVTEAENGELINPQFIYYTVYVNGEPEIDTYENRIVITLDRGCHMVYVTATRFDTDTELESKPSEVIGVCRE